MPTNWSFGGVQIGDSPSEGRLEDEIPLHLLVIGDFSGRGATQGIERGAALARRHALVADRDSIDDLPSRLNVRLLPACGDAGETLRIASLDDFDPDRILAAVDSLSRLLAARRRLQNPSTFDDAVRELQSLGAVASETTKKPDQPATKDSPGGSTPPVPAGGLFDAMLAETEMKAASDRPLEMLLQGQPTPGALAGIVRSLVEPHLVAKGDPRLPELTRAVDAALAAGLRSVLHDPAFQTVEAAWRGLVWLVRELDQGGRIKIHALDWSLAELVGDVSDVENSVLLRKLHGRPPVDGQPWGCVVVLHTLGATPAEVEAIGCLGMICEATKTATVVGVHDAVVGKAAHADQESAASAPSLAAEWQAMQSLGGMQHLSAAWPRHLLRMPYGRDSRPIDSFDFEEMPSPPERQRFLWGSAASVIGCLLGRAFLEGSWSAVRRLEGVVSGRPLYVFRADGETVAQSPVEHLPSESMIDALDERGLTILMGARNRDHVAIARVQSISRTPWRGHWG